MKIQFAHFPRKHERGSKQLKMSFFYLRPPLLFLFTFLTVITSSLCLGSPSHPIYFSSWSSFLNPALFIRDAGIVQDRFHPLLFSENNSRAKFSPPFDGIFRGPLDQFGEAGPLLKLHPAQERERESERYLSVLSFSEEKVSRRIFSTRGS